MSVKSLFAFPGKAVALLFLAIFSFMVSGCRAPGAVSGEAASVEEPAPTITAVDTAKLPPPNTFTIPTQTVPAPTPTVQVNPAVSALFNQEPFTSMTTFVLPLTVRHVTETGATLFFELNQPAEGALFYQPVSDTVQQSIEVPFLPGEARQQLAIQGLTPGVEYRALVGLKQTDGSYKQPAFLNSSWGSVRFRPQSTQMPLRVGVLGDASFGDSATEELVQRMTSYNLDFAIHTGDVVGLIEENNGPVEAYALKFYKTLSPLLHRMPVYTIIGNHDYDFPARWQESFFYYYAFPSFPEPLFSASQKQGDNQYYTFAYQGVQFMMLDSQVFFGVEGREAEQAWMTERLADTRFRFTIPVLHVPPYFSGSIHPDDGLAVRQFWSPLFAAAHTPLALSGHSHHYERLVADGVTYIVSGGGSATLYPAGEILPQSQVFASRTHFVLLEIYDDRIELSAISKDGDVLDRATIAVP